MPRLGNLVASVYREESATTGTLVDALCAASAEFLPIALDQEGYRDGRPYRYASVRSIRRSTQAALAKHGLWLNHVYGHTDQGTFCVTVLRHREGEYITSTLQVPQRADMQEQKSVMTLLCRTAIEGLLAICTEEDDDGACAATPSNEAQQAQWKANLALARKAIAEAASESDVARYVSLAEQRVKDGLMAPDAMQALATVRDERMKFLTTKKEKNSADSTGNAGDQGADAARSRGRASDRGVGAAAPTGRGDVRASDAGVVGAAG